MTYLIILVYFCLACFFTSCQSYKDDNIIEEYVESILEEKTGVDIDLTPQSEEIDARREDREPDGTFYVLQRDF